MADRGGLIAVVEGEKDADSLSDAGICATTSPLGAGKWRDEYNESLRGAGCVVLLPDNDDPGRKHAQEVARSIKKVVPCVRIVELEGRPEHGGDVSDWLTMGGTSKELLDLVRHTPDWTPDKIKRKVPPPMSMRTLIVDQERPTEWLVSGLIPTDANVLLAAYPKSGKTLFLEELAVSLASCTPFLGRFPVAGRRKVGIVLMEDRQSSTLRRLDRLCQGRGLALEELDGWLYLWSRPPLCMSDITVVELGEYAAELELDLIAVDSWSYVGTGNSNDSDEVMPQLQALSAAREKRPGLTVELTHHARKERADADPEALRLTDLIRNSSAFGAWYDTGIMLSRRNEGSPIKVRSESRDGLAIPPFALQIEDEHAGDAATGVQPEGWLRLLVADGSAEEIELREKAEAIIPKIQRALESLPDQTAPSKAQLLKMVRGDHGVIYAAIELMQKRSEVAVVQGKRNACSIRLIRR